MKRANTILAIILSAVMAGCGGRNKQSTEDFITIDVTKNYPQKELILQDFMDVEYIALDDADEFVTQGVVQAIGKELILVTNQFNDGDIFLFDRNGKGVRKINRRGGGSEEYLSISTIILDEDSGELFIADNTARKIMVYDLLGKFKRTIRYREGSAYGNIYSFNRENLI